MLHHRVSSFLLVLFFGAIFGAQSVSAQTAQGFFNSGLSALQKSDFKTARTEFQNSLKLDPHQTQTYYNWGWVEFKDQHLGLAIGLWRKALDVDPQNSLAQAALSFAQKKLEHPQIAHETDLWESFRSSLFLNTPLLNFLIMTNLFLLLSGWLWLKHWGLRKQALVNETPLPSIPVTAWLFTAGLLISVALSLAKNYDLQTPRGTVISKQLSVRTTPDANGTVLFDLFEGLEVIVQQSSSGWFQVTYPGGMTGWVPKNEIFLSAGRAP